MQLKVQMARFDIDREARRCWFINMSDDRPEGEDSGSNYRSVTSSPRLVLIRATPSSYTWCNAQRLTIFNLKRHQKRREKTDKNSILQLSFISFCQHCYRTDSIDLIIKNAKWQSFEEKWGRRKTWFVHYSSSNESKRNSFYFELNQGNYRTETNESYANLNWIETENNGANRNGPSNHLDTQLYLRLATLLAINWIGHHF